MIIRLIVGLTKKKLGVILLIAISLIAIPINSIPLYKNNPIISKTV